MRGGSLRERQRQVREDVILSAARELMAEQGYADMSMDDLAARAGVSKATLYQHFPSKEELAVNVIVRNMQRGEEYVTNLDPQLPAIVRLEQMLRHALEGRATFWQARATLPKAVVQHHQLYKAQVARMIAAVAGLVEQAKAAGSIAPHLATPVIVQMIINTIRDSSYGDLISAGACSQADLSDTLISILFDGVRSASGDVASETNTQ
jgi:AcrR family transcriptional regulator